MEYNILNIALVVSFSFVSVALGVKWIGEALIDYRMSQVGYIMSKLSKEELKEVLGENDES